MRFAFSTSYSGGCSFRRRNISSPPLCPLARLFRTGYLPTAEIARFLKMISLTPYPSPSKFENFVDDSCKFVQFFSTSIVWLDFDNVHPNQFDKTTNFNKRAENYVFTARRVESNEFLKRSHQTYGVTETIYEMS